MVLDASAEVAQDEDWLLTVEFIQDWERRHGRIPPRACAVAQRLVATRAGPGRLPQPAREDTPGPTQEAVQWLIRERDAHGFGVETINTDAGQSYAWPLPYPCHTLMHGANRYGLQCLKNLDQLPPQGAMIPAAPLKIEGGSGSLARAGAGGAGMSAPSETQVVSVGSGINSLVGAALLAVRGKRVLVLERNDRLGGCIRTEELFPGYRHEVFSSWHPLFVGSPGYAELKSELEQAGLEVLCGDYSTGLVGPDGRGLALRQDMADAARRLDALSPGDGLPLQDMAAHVRRGRRADLRPAGQEPHSWDLLAAVQRMAQARPGRHDRPPPARWRISAAGPSARCARTRRAR